MAWCCGNYRCVIALGAPDRNRKETESSCQASTVVLMDIAFVALWLFVLVPMLISKRDAVRRTSDLALATRRYFNGGAGAPGVPPRSDPDWKRKTGATPVEPGFADVSMTSTKGRKRRSLTMRVGVRLS